MVLLWLAGTRKIPATLSITADTGWERDMLWNTGRRSTAKEYFNEVTQPFAAEMGIEAVFVRAQDGSGNDLPDIDVAHTLHGYDDIPLFGSEGGRLQQSCTSKWKVAAIRQEARRRGATTMRSAIGLHMAETRRMKVSDVKWHTHYYPLITDFPMYRTTIQETLDRLGVPWLTNTQCDGCPHKDRQRWLNTSDATIQNLVSVEDVFIRDGFYLTSSRKPLAEYINDIRFADQNQPEMVFDDPGCSSGGYCFT